MRMTSTAMAATAAAFRSAVRDGPAEQKIAAGYPAAAAKSRPATTFLLLPRTTPIMTVVIDAMSISHDAVAARWGRRLLCTGRCPFPLAGRGVSAEAGRARGAGNRARSGDHPGRRWRLPWPIIAVLREQPTAFGRMTSDPTASRSIAALPADAPAALPATNTARSAARGAAWKTAGRAPRLPELPAHPGGCPTRSGFGLTQTIAAAVDAIPKQTSAPGLPDHPAGLANGDTGHRPPRGPATRDGSDTVQTGT